MVYLYGVAEKPYVRGERGKFEVKLVMANIIKPWRRPFSN